MILINGTRIPSESVTQTTTNEIISTNTDQSTISSISSSCVNTLITPSGRAPTIGWDFENNLNDRFGVYTGIGQNNPSYLIGRNGCGKCLNLTSILNQSVIINVTPYIDLRSISFSVEAWVKPRLVTDGIEHVILGQCSVWNTLQCMRTSIGNPGKMSFLFCSDTQLGSQIIPQNTWSHFAYTYNLSTKTMSLYLNGSLDATGGNHGPYQGTPTFFQIGNINAIGSIYFDGCIDDIFFYPFTRTQNEIAATFALG